MTCWFRLSIVVLVGVLVMGCAPLGMASTPPSSPQPDRPYAALQDRAIKALAPERIADLRAGRGAGYALAAELNQYPGPRHVLDLAGPLQLSPAQEQATRAIFTSMEQAAQVLGHQLVEREAKLDQAFQTGQITPAEVARLTREVARVEGELRATHLAAHLAVKEALTPEQVRQYDRLRGYASPDSGAPADQHGHDGQGHSQQSSQ